MISPLELLYCKLNVLSIEGHVEREREREIACGEKSFAKIGCVILG